MLFDVASLAPGLPYKLLTATIVPRPIAWITTLDADGTVNAAPFSFFNAVSGAPPVVVIGVGDRTPGDPKDTGKNIAARGEFVVNLVDSDLAGAMNVTAIDFPYGVSEMEQAQLATAPSVHVKTPRIAQSPVSLECTLHSLIPIGDERSVVLGNVVAFHIRDEFVLDAARCHIDTPKLDLIGRMH
jgi:flavin reductase (DIM6/NTAB) family NADH-FMN oxidoreductase RutF